MVIETFKIVQSLLLCCVQYYILLYKKKRFESFTIDIKNMLCFWFAFNAIFFPPLPNVHSTIIITTLLLPLFTTPLSSLLLPSTNSLANEIILQCNVIQLTDSVFPKVAITIYNINLYIYIFIRIKNKHCERQHNIIITFGVSMI